MENERMNFDQFDFKLSNSKHFSEVASLEKDEGFQPQLLEKSLIADPLPQKSPFFFSLEMDSSKEFLPSNPFAVNSPSRNGPKTFLNQFSKRFESLRKIAVEDEPFNSSLGLSLIKQESTNADKEPAQAMPGERRSTSSKVSNSPRDSNNSSYEMNKKSILALRSSQCLDKSTGSQESLDKSKVQGLSTFQKPATLRRKPQFKTFQKIYDTFHQLFSTGSLTVEDYELQDWEEEILRSLIQRKYFYKVTSKDTNDSLDEKVRRINEILGSRSNKRPEECYKFILTRIIKFLKKQFGSPSGLSPDEVERAFYDHYFAELANEMHLNVENFYYPITRKQLDKIKLNSNYFDKIFKSPQFLKDTLYYMENILREEYQEELKQKLRSFLSKYDLMIRRNPHKQEDILKMVREYLLKNKRCKLPWTVKEINEAIERFHILLDHFKIQNR